MFLVYSDGNRDQLIFYADYFACETVELDRLKTLQYDLITNL